MKAKNLSKLKAEAWGLYAQIIKLRYAENGYCKCFTCQKPIKLGTSDCHAGHYLPRGAYPGLTFHIDNVRPQCFRCNVHLHGNTIEFRERLVCEIGIEKVEALESARHEEIKLSKSNYVEMILNFKKVLKLYERNL